MIRSLTFFSQPFESRKAILVVCRLATVSRARTSSRLLTKNENHRSSCAPLVPKKPNAVLYSVRSAAPGMLRQYVGVEGAVPSRRGTGCGAGVYGVGAGGGGRDRGDT